MSTEIQVVFHGNLPGRAALTRTFQELDFPLSFQRGSGALRHHEGYLPMRFRGKESGIAFDTWDDRGVFELLKKAVDLPCGANFCSGASREERTVAICFAAVLARLTNGLVIGLLPDRRLTADEAITSAREELAAIEGNGN